MTISNDRNYNTESNNEEIALRSVYRLRWQENGLPSNQDEQELRSFQELRYMEADNMALLAHQVKALDLKVLESSKDQQKQKNWFNSTYSIWLPVIRIWQFKPFEIPKPLEKCRGADCSKNT